MCLRTPTLQLREHAGDEPDRCSDRRRLARTTTQSPSNSSGPVEATMSLRRSCIAALLWKIYLI